MKKFAAILISAALILISQTAFCQVRMSGNAKVVDNNGKSVGSQFISANIEAGRTNGTFTIGNLRMSAKINRTHRDNTYGITVYDCLLTTSDGRIVWACVNKHDNGHYTVVVDYATGKYVYSL